MSDEVKEHKVCFTVDGEWLADFARTRFDEGAWDRALSMLTDSLEGLSTDQAIAILKGEATLTGDSSSGIDIEVLPKDGPLAKRMAERMQYMYGDIFRISDKMWKPYAMVSGWNRDDHAFAIKNPKCNVIEANPRSSQRSLGYAGAARSLYYAKDQVKDMLICLEPRCVGGNIDVYTGDVLCEEVSASVPFWLKVPTNNPVEAVEAILKRKQLPVWGAFEGLSFVKSRAEAPGVVDQVEGTVERAEVLPHEAELEEGEKKLAKAERRALVVELINGSKNYLELEHTVDDLKEVVEMDRIFEKGIDVLHKEVKSDEWDVIDQIRDGFRNTREKLLGDKVNAQAEKNGGFMEIKLTTWNKERHVDVPFHVPSITVPKNAFLLWALRYVDFAKHGHVQPTWDIVAGSGWKMMNDDPYHTDWMLGARIPLKDTYDREDDEAVPSLAAVVRSCSFSLRSELNKEITGHDFTVLAKGEITYVIGEVAFPKPNERVKAGSIAVVPHAGPEYQNAMETANMENPEGNRGLIICDTGGKLAHLVIVGREFKCTVLMMPGATGMYREGERVCVNVSEGTITNWLV